ncbi:hypothetical protein FE257_012878 [Aspergillus nanangensis]|uniref:Protein PNS1 n=1 Tax=Aspergillus nanangensis TaxID=2582783 RepID=A0AAD4CFN7_ASPNN|nr:hypothetical protein FE257_012878 [Aspergillus nanangensis]
MFSEYASRFLAQSQSRIVPHSNESRRKGHVRHAPQPGSSRFPSSRSFLQRTHVDPYQPANSQISNFPFSSRNGTQPAPLFYSATDEFREEDDEVEREREIADFYALQRSRRHFGSSYLKQSSELEEDDSSLDKNELDLSSGERGGTTKGIRSSWRVERSGYGPRGITTGPVEEELENENESSQDRSNNKHGDRLVEVRLEDTIKSSPDLERDRLGTGDDDPPSIQRFREQPQHSGGDSETGSLFSLKGRAEGFPLNTDLRSPSPVDSYQSTTEAIKREPLMHDAFWAHLFLISLACLFATSFLVYLHTSSPPRDRSKWGDTIYTTVHGSFYLLGCYTVVSIFISLVWLALLRAHVRQLVFAVMFAVPMILYSFALYPFISSFKGSWNGASVQDKMMRVGSIVPFIMASVWTYNVIRGRHAIGRAVAILEFSCRILSANTELLGLGLCTLVFIVSWTWAWMLMFTRVFLGGHMSGSRHFIINVSSWWLGIYFIFVYIWSLGVVAGIQRAVTAATSRQQSVTPLPRYSEQFVCLGWSRCWFGSP